MRVKICGVTRPDDARAAADLGAWAVGMILSPRGPRALDRARAEAVRAAIPAGVLAVGVFVDEPPAHVASMGRALALDLVQLHGNESPADLEAIPIPAMKVFHVEVAAGRLPESLELWGKAYAALFDARAQGKSGGTGKAFDWSLLDAPELRGTLPSGRLVLAGGLEPGNVAAAIRAVTPFAIDVSSGVEASPGVKDRARLEALFRAAR